MQNMTCILTVLKHVYNNRMTIETILFMTVKMDRIKFNIKKIFSNTTIPQFKNISLE